jgi:hypothetical protein
LPGSLVRIDTLDRHGWHPVVTAGESAPALAFPASGGARREAPHTRRAQQRGLLDPVVSADTPAAASGSCALSAACRAGLVWQPEL